MRLGVLVFIGVVEDARKIGDLGLGCEVRRERAGLEAIDRTDRAIAREQARPDGVYVRAERGEIGRASCRERV